MKLTCNREKLLHAFQLASGVAPQRSPKPILENIKLEANAIRLTSDGHGPGSRHPHRGSGLGGRGARAA